MRVPCVAPLVMLCIRSSQLWPSPSSIIDIVFGCYIANRVNADPLWLMVIAAPSNMKTELLNALADHPTTYSISTFTPQTLISGKKVARNNPEPSLLYELNKKLVIMKDFTTILSMRSEPRQEIFGQLREVYDGSFKKAFGTGDMVPWKGKVGFIAACTSVYDKHSIRTPVVIFLAVE